MTLTKRDDAILAQESSQDIADLERAFAVAVRQRELLEDYIKARLKKNKHFYTVPGSDKPSITKEGAEIICLPHGLKPDYSIVSGPDQPPNDDAPYQITVLCRLLHNERFAGSGIGSASSHVTTKEGERKVRQRDIGLRHNATLKMAQKSAYVAATLNATAASEFFTQDMEDTQEDDSQQDVTSSTNPRFCLTHQTPWFKKGKMRNYAHPIGDTGEWCNMPSAMPATAPTRPAQPAQVVQPSPSHAADADLPLPSEVKSLGALFNYGRSIGYPGRIEMFKALGVTNDQAFGTVEDLQAAAQKLHDLKEQEVTP